MTKKKAPKKVHLLYSGPFEAELVLVPTRRRITVAPGGVVELLPNEAASFNGAEGWSLAPVTTIKKEAI